jgi:hypothetical protein
MRELLDLARDQSRRVAPIASEPLLEKI